MIDNMGEMSSKDEYSYNEIKNTWLVCCVTSPSRLYRLQDYWNETNLVQFAKEDDDNIRTYKKKLGFLHLFGPKIQIRRYRSIILPKVILLN